MIMLNSEKSIHFYPEIIQIEITTLCNFNCKMCLRSFQKDTYQNMPLEQFEALAKQIFPKIKKVVLYGHGEPLMHPDFEKIVKITRKYLPKDGKIDFTTNGSLLTPSKLDQILKNNINRIVVSFDTSNFMKLKEIRAGIQEDRIVTNFHYLSTQRKEGKLDELAIETVIMRSNFHDLPYLIEYCSEFNVDTIYVSHVLAFDESLLPETLYFTISKESWENSQEIVKKGWELFEKAMFDPVDSYAVSRDTLVNATKNVNTIWERIRERGIENNHPLIFEASKKIDQANETERVFNKAKTLAQKLGIKLELPEIFPILRKRECPYINQKAIIVRVDGGVAPCYNFLHNHKVYVNNHERDVKEITFGNLQNESLEKIVQGPYHNFRKILLDISKNVPWSGDCLYSTQNCFFVTNNDFDCYGNHPACNECLYSVGLVRCIF